MPVCQIHCFRVNGITGIYLFLISEIWEEIILIENAKRLSINLSKEATLKPLPFKKKGILQAKENIKKNKLKAPKNLKG